MKLTGEIVNKFGREYHVATCKDGESIESSLNLLFKDSIKPLFIRCEGYLDCEGDLVCKTFYQVFGAYKIGFHRNLDISIGCERRSAKEWNIFLESDEIIRTDRTHANFPLIEASIVGAIAMQPYILKRLNWK